MSYALDLSVPENRFPRNTGIARSRIVDDWIVRYFDADAEGDASGRRAALRAIIDTNRADHSAAGIPVYAHAPLPNDFVGEVISAIQGLPAQLRHRAVESFAADVDQNARPMVMQQLTMQVSERKPGGMPVVGMPDPDLAEARRRGDDIDANDPLAALAHPFAYGGDTAMDDLFGKEGLLGDWGWRRKVPPPSNLLPRAAGEGLRFYLQGGPFAGLRVGRLGRGAGAADDATRTAKGGAAAKRGATGAKPEGQATASRSESTMGKKRMITCHVKCRCRAVRNGADCPPWVYGTGQGPTQKIAWDNAYNAANDMVPDGCQKNHCHGPCR